MIEIACRRAECRGVLRLEIEGIENLAEAVCPECGQGEQVSAEAMSALKMLADLVGAIRRAEPILGRTGVAVTVADAEVVIPYRLLLSRLTTEMALEIPGAPRRVRVYPDTVTGASA